MDVTLVNTAATTGNSNLTLLVLLLIPLSLVPTPCGRHTGQYYCYHW